MAKFGLRGKSLLAILLVCLLALIPASLIGWQVLDSINHHFGEAFARNTTLLNRSKITTPMLRELALSRRLAGSELTRNWLRQENNPQARAAFFREAEGYRQDLHDKVYFIGSARSRNYYFNEAGLDFSDQPRYVQQPERASDSWFFKTLASPGAYNINVDQSAGRHDVKIWFNILVREQSQVLGVVGAAINLTSFLQEFIRSQEPGVTAMVVNPQGAIQLHPDARYVAINSAVGGQVGREGSLFGLLDDGSSRDAMTLAMHQAEKTPGSVVAREVMLQGRQQIVALSYLPELRWHILTAVDPAAAPVLEGGWLWSMLAALLLVLLLLVFGFAFAVERMLIQPLQRLRESARAVASGQYDLALPAQSSDEIGELTQAFASMADTVRRHTGELEARVSQRTQALEQANQDMCIAQKKIADSINYASLIQRAILPKMVTQALPQHDVLWLPRDVVGGDFYLQRNSERGTLLGVVDCAGHGVPGAMMTMLAYAALDQAIALVGMDDPAAILTQTDTILRGMLPDQVQTQTLATNMDVALAYLDITDGQLLFSGAKMALYYTDGETVHSLAAGRRALGDKRRGEYVNEAVSLPRGSCCYLVSDGFLDQAGGDKGYGFGVSRFSSMVRKHAHLPLSAQLAAFRQTLANYQGSYPQRDDITLLCFSLKDSHSLPEVISNADL